MSKSAGFCNRSMLLLLSPANALLMMLILSTQMYVPQPALKQMSGQKQKIAEPASEMTRSAPSFAYTYTHPHPRSLTPKFFLYPLPHTRTQQRYEGAKQKYPWAISERPWREQPG